MRARSLGDDTLQNTVQAAARALAACYEEAQSVNFNAERLKSNCLDFCKLSKALAISSNGVNWRVKPKLHMFWECCAAGTRPDSCWTYRDEDFGGYAAKTSGRRGGKNSVAATSASLIDRFCAKYPVPAVRS